MIHGLISLLYNGLLRGASWGSTAVTDCLAGWLDDCLAHSDSAQAASATAACCPRLKSFDYHEKQLSENRERGCAHTHIKGNGLIQYRLTKYLGA